MSGYIIRRLLGLVPTLLVIASLTFFIMRIAPGGPFDSERVLPEEVEKNIAAKYHLDEPLFKQYFHYLENLLKGDLGPSFKYPNRTVNEIIKDGFPVSLTLGFFALLLALSIGIPAGIMAGLKQNTKIDNFLSSISTLGISIPSFVLAPLLILIFALKLKIFPVTGWGSWKNVVLPTIALSGIYIAYIARLSRAGIVEIIHQDFIRTARAKGLSEKQVVLRHALKGALLPVVSFLGPASAGILTGSVVIETIFNIPGIGRFFVTSALNRDYTMVLGTILCYSALLILFNLIVDIVYAYLDPRVRYK